jgi:tetratricopeptide (TPR) repeat protein
MTYFFVVCLTLWTVLAGPGLTQEGAQGITSTNQSTQGNKQETTSAAKKPYLPEAIKHYNEGVKLHQGGFLNQAIVEYEAAIVIDGRMIEAMCNLGVLYSAKQSYDKAIECYQKALTIEENIGVPKARRLILTGLAAAYTAKGQYADAEQSYKQALMIDGKGLRPDDAETLGAYAALLRKTNRPIEAAELEQRAKVMRAGGGD